MLLRSRSLIIRRDTTRRPFTLTDDLVQTTSACAQFLPEHISTFFIIEITCWTGPHPESQTPEIEQKHRFTSELILKTLRISSLLVGSICRTSHAPPCIIIDEARQLGSVVPSVRLSSFGIASSGLWEQATFDHKSTTRVTCVVSCAAIYNSCAHSLVLLPTYRTRFLNSVYHFAWTMVASDSSLYTCTPSPHIVT